MRTTKPHFIHSLLLIIAFNGIFFYHKLYAFETKPLSVSLSRYNLLCNDDKSGLIDVEVNGGVKPYTYKWNNGATTEDISGLAAGVYTVQVKDAAGSVFYASTEITQPEKIKIDAVVVESNAGKNDGRIQLYITGGSGGYEYLWSDNSYKSYLTNLEEGIYAVKVSDKNQCFETSLFRVHEILKVNVRADVYNLLCFNDATGAIDLTVTGGKQPYHFQWSNGAATEDITGLNEGKYSVKIYDAAGQVIEKQFSVTQPEQLAVMASVTDETYKNASNGGAVVEISGGIKPYKINWDNGYTDHVIKNLASGLYQVTVTDARQCEAVHEVLISESSVSTLVRKKLLTEELSTISIVPNPASEYVTISAANQQLISVTLYDLNGKKVKYASNSGYSLKMDMKDLNTGFYTLVVVTNAGTQLQKIAKTN